MQLAASRARDGRVRDLANEHVLERVLRVAGELAGRIAPDEVARLERLQRLVDIDLRTDAVQDAAPERAADHRRGEQRVACMLRQRIDAGGDRFPDGHRQLVARAEFGHRRRQLFEEQGVPARDVDEPVGIDSHREVICERARCVVRERLERNRRLCPQPGPPRRMGVEKLRPRRREQRRRRFANELAQVRQQLELAAVGPVNVFEQE